MIRTVTAGMARSLAAAIEETVPTRRTRAYIGLGANVGDATATLVAAVGGGAAVPRAPPRGAAPPSAPTPRRRTPHPDPPKPPPPPRPPPGAPPPTPAA